MGLHTPSQTTHPFVEAWGSFFLNKSGAYFVCLEEILAQEGFTSVEARFCLVGQFGFLKISGWVPPSDVSVLGDPRNCGLSFGFPFKVIQPKVPSKKVASFCFPTKTFKGLALFSVDLPQRLCQKGAPCLKTREYHDCALLT